MTSLGTILTTLFRSLQSVNHNHNFFYIPLQLVAVASFNVVIYFFLSSAIIGTLFILFFFQKYSWILCVILCKFLWTELKIMGAIIILDICQFCVQWLLRTVCLAYSIILFLFFLWSLSRFCLKFFFDRSILYLNIFSLFSLSFFLWFLFISVLNDSESQSILN